MMIGKIIRVALFLLLLTTPLSLSAQSKKVDEQRRRVEQYKRDVESAKREVSNLKKEKASASKRVEALNHQMNLRSSYIAETERERELVEADIATASAAADSLHNALEHNRALYAEAVRVAYRNYRQNNYTTFIFSSEDISDAARRMAQVQHVADQRRALAEQIIQQEEELASQRKLLATRSHELDSIGRSLEEERRSLEDDKREAQKEYNSLSDKEKKALSNQRKQQMKLDSALAELRKLTAGNKTGSSFNDKTKNLNLPVVGGAISKVNGNTATITAQKGSAVRSIYEGKVIRISRDNTNHQQVFIAHGQYISVYMHLSSVCVAEGSTVQKDQKIGTIGIAIDHKGVESAYMLFMINHSDPNKTMSVMECFKK